MKINRILLIIILTIFFSFSLCSCSSNKIKETKNFEIVNKVEHKASAKEEYNVEANYVNLFNTFAYKTSLNIFNNKKNNQIYSPISLLIALSMIAEGADGVTLSELNNVLYCDVNTLRNGIKNTILNNEYDNDGGKLRIANSIWLHKNMSFKDEYVNTLCNDYKADIFRAAFDSETKKNILKWMNNNTFDFLNVKEDDFDLTDVVLFLVNSIYFNNKWQSKYLKNNTYASTFYSYNGDVSADFMHHEIYGEYFLGEHFTLACDYFNNNNKITYVLPNEGYTVEDIFKEDQFYLLLAGKTNFEKTSINYSLPKFKYQLKYTLRDNLIDLGLESLFDANECNLSKISDERLYFEYIDQICGIELDEEGAKAAAITFGGAKAEEASPCLYMNLNKPFIYYITDSNDVILFMGIIYNPIN